MFKSGGFIHFQIHANSSGARLIFIVSAHTLGQPVPTDPCFVGG